jgi:hypothetical protein
VEFGVDDSSGELYRIFSTSFSCSSPAILVWVVLPTSYLVNALSDEHAIDRLACTSACNAGVRTVGSLLDVLAS